MTSDGSSTVALDLGERATKQANKHRQRGAPAALTTAFPPPDSHDRAVATHRVPEHGQLEAIGKHVGLLRAVGPCYGPLWNQRVDAERQHITDAEREAP